MAYRASPELVSFDAERALDRALAVAPDLLLFAEVTDEDYTVLYVSEAMQARFEETEADLFEVGDRIHEYEVIDFFEREVMEDLLAVSGEVQGFSTFAERAIVTRIVDEQEGIYFTVPRDTDVRPLVDELEPIVRG